MRKGLTSGSRGTNRDIYNIINTNSHKYNATKNKFNKKNKKNTINNNNNITNERHYYRDIKTKHINKKRLEVAKEEKVYDTSVYIPYSQVKFARKYIKELLGRYSKTLLSKNDITPIEYSPNSQDLKHQQPQQYQIQHERNNNSNHKILIDNHPISNSNIHNPMDYNNTHQQNSKNINQQQQFQQQELQQQILAPLDSSTSLLIESHDYITVDEPVDLQFPSPVIGVLSVNSNNIQQNSDKYNENNEFPIYTRFIN